MVSERRFRRRRQRRNFVFPFLLLVVSIYLEVVFCADFVPSGWNLPPITKENRRKEHFLNECDQTLATFFNLVSRGGGGGNDGRRYNNNNADRPSNDYDNNNYYRPDDEQQQPYNDDYYTPRRRTGREADYYDEYYDDGISYPEQNNNRKTPASPSFISSLSSVTSSMPGVIKNGDRKIGLGLLGSGAIISLIGISLFFNRTLMRLGNLLFIAGIPMTIGPTRTIGYFAKPEKIRATSCLALGIFLVFIGHPTFGIALEIFGLLNLFGNMFPMLMFLVKQMPGVNTLFNAGAGSSNPPRKKDEERNDYYDEYYEPDYDGQPQQQQPYGYDDNRNNNNY